MGKLLIVVCVVAVGAVLFVKAGFVSAQFVTSSERADGTVSVNCHGDCADVYAAAGSPLMQDVTQLVRANHSASLTRAGANFGVLMAHARRLRHTSGAALLRRRAPVVGALAAEESLLADRLRAVPVRTTGGEACRRAAVRLILRYVWVLGRFQRDVAQGSWAAVRRFDANKDASDRSYAGDVRPCLAEASNGERDQVAQAMGLR